MTYVPLTQARPHQVEACNRMRGKRAFALLMAMRTGKTKTAIDDFGEMELAGEVRDLLVLAPKGSYRTWTDEFAKHASTDLQDRALLHVWRSGGGANHDKSLRTLLASADLRVPRVLTMNIEALSMAKAARQVAERFVTQRRAEIVVDESTTIKGHGTERTKFVVRKLKPLSSYRRILTGLPTPRDPLDLYYQFAFLDQGILGAENYYAFRARYAEMQKIVHPGTNRLVDIVVGFKPWATTELNSLIDPFSYRIRLEDIVNLPVSYTFRHVDMTDEQRKTYRALKEQAIVELASGGTVSAPMVIVRMLRLHQILMGYVKDVDGEIRELPERRTDALMELLEEYDGKAIIWVSYGFSVERVSQALEEKYGAGSVARFWGGNSNTREEDDRRFRSDPACRFMVATPDSGGRGRRWDVADMVVYYSSRDNLEHRDQSEERAKDMTKTNATLYVDLIVPDTVEERIIKALRQKIDLASAITGANYREWLI